MTHEDLKAHFDVPQDVVDAAKQVGMDAATLGKLLIRHTEESVMDFLDWLRGKLS